MPASTTFMMRYKEYSPGKAFVTLWGKPDGTVNYFSDTGIEIAVGQLNNTCGKESFIDALFFILDQQFTIKKKELSLLQKFLKQSASSVVTLITKVIIPTLGNNYNGIVDAAGASHFNLNLVQKCSVS